MKLTQEYRKSSVSTWFPHNNCVEVSTSVSGNMVYVRDSKDPAGGKLSFTKEEWSAFIQGVKKSEFEV